MVQCLGTTDGRMPLGSRDCKHPIN